MSTIPSWCRKGVKVVCVDDHWTYDALVNVGESLPDRVPMLNEVLTISKVWGKQDNALHLEAALVFEETGPRFGYSADCFRPLVTKDHEAEDLATFRKWLRVDQPQGVDA